MRDESDRKSKLRLVIEPRTSKINPEEMMTALMVHTSLETRYAINLTWLGLDGLPETKGIVEVLREWGEWRVDTVRRRTQFRLDRVQERLELVLGPPARLRQDRRDHQADPRERGPGRGQAEPAEEIQVHGTAGARTSSTCASASSPSSTASS